MASHQDLSHQACEIVDHAQVEKDHEALNQASAHVAHDAQDKASTHDQSAQLTASDLKDQAANFLQQTGEQVKNIAQGAAEAVKMTLGMNTDNSPSTNPSTDNSTQHHP